MIEVKGISKYYGSTLAVDDVSFNVHRGEIVGFLGPNGAGKSTTMKILTCFLAPSAGTALVDGHDIIEQPLKARSQIGYLPENTPLYDEMGVIEFLHFIAGLQQLSASERRNRVDELVDICGLAKMAHKDIGALSKGYRQRVGLAQALLPDPPVLILDEPTSGLDPKQIVEIRQLIKDIAREKAILLSTHILPEAQNTCSRILIINEGRIVGEGTSDELLNLAAGEDRYTVTIKGNTDPVPALEQLPHVISVVRIADSPEPRFQLSTERGRDLRENIFDLCVEHQLKLLELHHESTSLEDVFLKLTGSHGDGIVVKEKAPAAAEAADGGESNE
jgi:ABC-2 type transport system ATP-binding protein